MSITVTKTSAVEWRMLVPEQGGPTSRVVEYRLVRDSSGVWSLHGVYGRDLTAGTFTQLSDTTDSAVYEYAIVVGDSGAGAVGFGFFGCGHLNESISATMTVLLDGASLTAWTNGQTGTGSVCVFSQFTNMLRPVTAAGVADGVTVIGSGTLTHTFASYGVLIEHTHVENPGYVCRTAYAHMHPHNAANFNSFRVNGGTTQTFLGNGSVTAHGRVTLWEAWHSTLHDWKANVVLVTGGLDVNGSWTRSPATPGETICIHNAAYPKVYWQYMAKATYPEAENLGTTSHRALYAVGVLPATVLAIAGDADQMSVAVSDSNQMALTMGTPS